MASFTCTTSEKHAHGPVKTKRKFTHSIYTNNDVCAEFHAAYIKTESNDHNMRCKRAKTEIFPFKRLQIQFPSFNNAFTVYELTATFIRDFWRVIGIWMVFYKKNNRVYQLENI